MPTDLPALTRLTEDVVAAMHAAEQVQRRRHNWRRSLPLLAVLAALLIPIALGLRAAAEDDPPPSDQGNAHAFATAAEACGIGAGAAALTLFATRAAEGTRGLQITAGQPCR